jgi:hypothetical protein
MDSVAETGGDCLHVGFGLVAELTILGVCIWFALELREFRELEGVRSLAVVDTGRDHLDNH